jgi:hypothetical protein
MKTGLTSLIGSSTPLAFLPHHSSLLVAGSLAAHLPVGAGDALFRLYRKGAMRWGVSCPALHLHWAVSTPSTLRLYKNFASPIRPVRACTSTELSAFLSLECSLSTASFGGGSVSALVLLPQEISPHCGGSMGALVLVRCIP